VRQGGLLSLALFAVFMELITCLKSSRYGCYLRGVYYGCIVYADDILLLSPSVCLMQKMLDICESSVDDCNMRFNCTKSFALIIGPRFLCNCALTLCGEPLIYVTSVKYLGVYSTAAKSFVFI